MKTFDTCWLFERGICAVRFLLHYNAQNTNIMLQTTNIPQQANVLLLPARFHLTSVMCDLEKGLETKQMLSDVFMSFLLKVDHGGELTIDDKEDLYCLYQDLQTILDLITLQTTH